MDSVNNGTVVNEFPEPDRSLPIHTRDTYLLIATFATVLIAMGILFAFMHRNCRQSLSRVRQWLLHVRHSNPKTPRNRSSRFTVSLGLMDPCSPIFSKELHPVTAISNTEYIVNHGSSLELSEFTNDANSNYLNEADSGISVISVTPTIFPSNFSCQYRDRHCSSDTGYHNDYDTFQVQKDVCTRQCHEPTSGNITFLENSNRESTESDVSRIIPQRIQLVHGSNSPFKASDNKIMKNKQRKYNDSDDSTEEINCASDKESGNTYKGNYKSGYTERYNLSNNPSSTEGIFYERRRHRQLCKRIRNHDEFTEIDVTYLKTADWIYSNDRKSNISSQSICEKDVYYDGNRVCMATTNAHKRSLNKHSKHRSHRSLDRFSPTTRQYDSKKDGFISDSSIECLDKNDSDNLWFKNDNNRMSRTNMLTFDEIIRRKSHGRKLPRVPSTKWQL